MHSGRFLGGHYDSTKQKAAFQNSLKIPGRLVANNYDELTKAFYHKAKIRLMIDMIFSKTVVLTYAQVMDGFFYHLLVQNYFEDNFIQALNNDLNNSLLGADPLIEIRVNPNTRNLVHTAQSLMLRQERFIFSSLDSFQPGLSKKFHDFLGDKGFSQSENMIGISNRDFSKVLRDNWESTEHLILSRWLNDLEIMYHDIPEWYIRPWDGDFNQNLIRAKDLYNNRYPEVLNFFENLKRKYDSADQIELLDQIIAEFSDNNILPNRSLIFTRLEECGFGSDDQDTIKAKYNDLMNRAMAIQHSCGLCDEGVNPQLNNDPGTIIDCLSRKHKDKLADMKWPEFFRWLRNHHGLREQIWNAEPKQLPKRAKRLANELIDAVNQNGQQGFLWKQLIQKLSPGVAVFISQYFTAELWEASVNLDQLVFIYLVNILSQHLSDRGLVQKSMDTITDVCQIARYATDGLYGGGSNPMINDTAGIAFTKDPAGAPIDSIIPMAMLMAHTPESEDNGINSIFRGDPNARN